MQGVSMVPRKFNIVDFGGFDLANDFNTQLPGIYDKIVDAHWNCVYIMCFGLKFAEIDVAPQYIIPELHEGYIMLNNSIRITRDDFVYIPGIEPPPPEPVIEPLFVAENGTYTTSEGVDGFNPVTVSVSASVSEVDTPPTAEEIGEGEAAILVLHEVSSDQKPVVTAPSAGIAGQNSGNAMSALNKSGTPDGSYTWTTADRNYNNLWIGADFGTPIILNFVTLAPRTWGASRQIYTVILEASNDFEEWFSLGQAYRKGNELPLNKWYSLYVDNQQPYRYYRLRTTTDSSGTINGSVTFTLYGLGFGYSQQIPEDIAEAFYKKSGVMYTFIRQ